MKSIARPILLAGLSFGGAVSSSPAGPPSFDYEPVVGWCELPGGAILGNTHGGVVLDREGRVYFNTDTERSILVYSPEGKFLRYFGEEYPGIHSMLLREEGGEEFIYAAHLAGKQAVKFRLDGSVVWTIGFDAVAAHYDKEDEYNPTAVAVGPQGRIFIADGYGKSLIHEFDQDRNLVRTFGGLGEEPGKFKTCHGLALDTRGERPRLLVSDRENRRLQYFDLDGHFLSVAAAGLRRPCSVAFWGEYTAVAELEGRVTIFDGEFQPVARVGDNPDRSQWAKNPVPPEEWKPGVFTAPHACAFDPKGNLYVMDWNKSGRISKMERRPQ